MRLGLWLVAFVSLVGGWAGAEEVVPVLESAGRAVLSVGEYHFKTAATVEKLKEVPQVLKEQVEQDFQQVGEKPPAKYDAYRYHFTITNAGKTDIQFFPFDLGSVASPLTDTLQSFHANVPAGKVLHLSYLTIDAPSGIIARAHIGIRDEKTRRFRYAHGVTTVKLYRAGDPRTNSFLAEPTKLTPIAE